MKSLVVISCGKKKIWDIDPQAGPTPARDVYQGPPFKANREYAEKFARDSWLILSAKYGFISPDFVIPGNYNVTFNNETSNPVSIMDLREQVRGRGLDQFDEVVVLGGSSYARAVRAAFEGTKARILAPLLQLPAFPPGTRVSAVKQAIRSNTPFGASSER